MWTLMRLDAGDYLAFDEDRRHLFRVAAYDEDGSATVGGRQARGRRWAAHRLVRDRAGHHVLVQRDGDGRAVRVARADAPVWDTWDAFTLLSDGHRTRRDALAALPT